MILLTGANGFLGKSMIKKLGVSNVITLSRKKSHHQIDLKNEVPVFENVFDTVIHAAGKAHLVPKTEKEKKDFFSVNVTGTENLLKGLERSGLPEKFVFVSSVSVYGISKGILIDENSPLLAKDPYGLSKINAEQLVRQWCKTNNVICTIFRLPLLVGTNPPGNLNALIKSIKKGYYFNIAGGGAKKSMVMIDDVATIISKAALIGGVFNLTDGYHPSFLELSDLIANQLGKSKPLNIPMWIALVMAKVGDLISSKAPINSDKLVKITSDLTFDDSKARQMLGWKPTPVLNGFKIS